MLTPASSDLFNLPFFQFSQLKKYQPESIPEIKADYKEHWLVWQQLIGEVAQNLGQPFAKPHIERWCNGWQVRAHFFAYFKYAQYHDSAAILSILLNRRRLSVSLDWHCYKAGISPITLTAYNQWLDDFNQEKYADFDMWHGAESEYSDYQTVAQLGKDGFILQNKDDFFCIGKHINRDDLGKQDEALWITDTIRQLIPLYEACYR